MTADYQTMPTDASIKGMTSPFSAAEALPLLPADLLQHADMKRRSEFVRWLYLILAGQCVLIGFVSLAFKHTMELALRELNWVVVLSQGVMITAAFVALKNNTGVRKSSMNWFKLLAMTVSMGCAAGFVDAVLGMESGLVSAVVLAMTYAGMALFVHLTKNDLVCPGLWPYALKVLISMASIVVVVILLWLAKAGIRWGAILLDAQFVMLTVCYAMHNIRRIAGGVHEAQLQAHEYGYAALLLYVDGPGYVKWPVKRALQLLIGEEQVDESERKIWEYCSEKVEEVCGEKV